MYSQNLMCFMCKLVEGYSCEIEIILIPSVNVGVMKSPHELSTTLSTN